MSPTPELTRSMMPSLRSLAPQLIVAGVLPVVAYSFLRPHVASDAVALAGVLIFPVAEILAERLWRGHFEPIGIIALIGIGAGLIGATLLNGDATLLKIRESLVTGLFGVVCLLSLGARRPATFYLGRSFATGGDAGKLAEFDKRWSLPTVPRRFRIVTAAWGVGLVGEAVGRVVLAMSISTRLFLVTAQVVNSSVLGGLFWFTILYSRAGERQVAAIVAARDASLSTAPL